MSKLSVIEKNFYNKLEEGGVVKWCKKRNTYNNAKKDFQKYQQDLCTLVKSNLSENEFNIFERTLELFKESIYDIELEEKIYYFKEGQKEGMQIIKELFESN